MLTMNERLIPEDQLRGTPRSGSGDETLSHGRKQPWEGNRRPTPGTTAVDRTLQSNQQMRW